ncbi:transcriptional regulator [Aminipila butyrica]|uniref:Transcriptional regulator n=1 Tax=Aminipila butyrica TaxID=433296 RepID=A0A858BS82_9FIRM|nr:transcriptional regulator [Aminipila butyrica]
MKKSYLTCKEVMEITGVKEAKAYQFINTVNRELKANGFITVAGKVSKRAFFEHYPVDDEVREVY